MTSTHNKGGWINKEGEKVLNWKKRYLSIESEIGRISYYTKDNKKEKKGEILLKTIKDVRFEKDYKTKKFCFFNSHHRWPNLLYSRKR